MKFRILSLLFIFSTCLSTLSQAQLIPITLHEQGTMYFLGGMNRNWFTSSDINFKGPGYDFSVSNLSAHDRWQPSPHQDWPFSTPQFSYRMGYIFKGQAMIGFEIGFDHIIYIVNDKQYPHIAGTIGDSSITATNLYFAKPGYSLEHYNGSNDITLSFVKQFPIISSPHDAHVVIGEIKPGGGVLLPRSDVTLFGQSQLHGIQPAGYMFGMEAGIRYTFIHHISLEISGKGSYVNYSNLLTVGGGYATQNYLTFECLATLGYQFKL